MENTKTDTNEQPNIHATLPYPDHSDMRGFSYRAPQVVTEPETDAKSLLLARQANPNLSDKEEDALDKPDEENISAMDHAV